MKWLETDTENCPVHRTLDLVGEKWTLLILRDAFNGVRRYDDFRRHIGLSEAVLADRLRKLVASGILRAVPYREPGARTRNEYRLTSKGVDLWPVMLALKQWGDTHTGDPAASPLDVHHTACGSPVEVVVRCAGEDAEVLTAREVTATPRP
ncbi:winged helix-turn-helix transcriptional regulator [Streptomyces filamentosus]|uniref:Transcriptional regulator n=1 Tax=Streptomyces filamentosus TaxID=67294 RepID=A0A919BYH9_STRFL|nr:helix-turn-helix domain-containing protein [Streptomyces filamentosus]GHG26008.1 transcriptional regulator [Streptomyces filamentosus]